MFGEESRWIATPLRGTGYNAPPSPMLRRRFELSATPVRAILTITALGLYEPWLNGQRVGREELQPGWTDYRKRLHARTYDVIEHLRAGGNILGCFLGDGWYSGKVSGSNRGCTYGTQPALRATLEATDAQGRVTCVNTDGDWQWCPGPVRSADLMDGEHYDARYEVPGWCDPAVESSVASADAHEHWQAVRVVKPQIEPARIEPSPAPPIRVTEALRVVAEPVRLGGWDGVRTIFDFGQNFAGKVRLSVKGPAGATLRLRYAEVLKPGGKELDRSNLRSCIATDTYTLRGDPRGETWSPRFTFHGFRYCEVSHDQRWSAADAEVPIQSFTRESLVGLPMHSDMPVRGTFRSGHDLLNRLQQNIVWGARSNFIDVPTDCPQRDERLGWTGDAQVFAATASFNFDTTGFYHKWLNDLEDAQQPGGEIPRVAPNVNPYADAGAGWSDAVVVVPWQAYRASGDRALLAEHFDMMDRWARYQANTATDGTRGDPDGDIWAGFGDWLALDGGGNNPFDTATPRLLVGTAYHAYSQRLFARIARLLGREQEAARAGHAAERAAAAFRRHFVTDGRVNVASQTAHLMALAFDLLEPSLRPTVFQDLLGLLEQHDGHLATGFLGTPLWCDTLTRFGRIDLACDLLLTQTYPGWLYPVTLGATTMWERWNSWHPDRGFVDTSMNSLNHYAYGAVGDWMYRHVAGIDLDLAEDTGPLLRLQPWPDVRLGHCEAALDAPVGRIESHWRIEDGKTTYRFAVPVGIKCELALPGEARREIGAGRHEMIAR